MKNKAQVTAFVILGLVMLILVFFSMFLLSNISSMEFEERANQAVSDFLATSAINSYVTSCMEDATQEAVYELFLYGGLDNQSFSDLRDDQVFESQVFRVNATQHIFANYSYICGLNESNHLPPSYPAKGASFSEYLSIYNDELECRSPREEMIVRRGGLFGANNFSGLCYSDSENNDGPIGPCRISADESGFNTALRNFNYDANTFENKLEESIVNKTESCVDFSLFEDFEGHNISRLNIPAKSSLNFANEGFSVTITYPFSVALENRQPVITEYNFSIESDLRLTRFQSLIMSALAVESSDIFFNISSENDLSEISFFDNFVFVNRSVSFDDGGAPNGTFVKFTDTASSVFGNNLSFSTFIPARRPALDLIEYASPLSQFDVIVLEGQDITIDPLGRDPDDYEVSYFYDGWKENHSVLFNYSEPGCESGSRDFQSFSDFNDCLVTVDDNPMEWTDSQMFQDTFRKANVSTSEFDIGPRNFTVGVRDIFGLYDFQVISVMVVEEPSLNLTFNSPFANMPENYLSIEDPFVFNSSDYGFSDIYEGTVREALFEILTSVDSDQEDVEFTEEVLSRRQVYDGENELDLLFTQPSPSNIFNITYEPFTQVKKYLLRSELDIYSDVLNDEVTAVDERVVDAVVCAPHRSSSFAYPYGNQENVFLNNHTCCLGDFENITDVELANDDVSCFDSNWYGVKSRVESKAEELSSLSSDEITDNVDEFNIGSSVSPENSDNFNSVWTLDFQRSCDGSRGNICAGDIDYQVVEHLSCNDEFENSHPQCVGPSSSLSETALACSYIPMGQTFDSRYASSTDNSCSNGLACSTAGGEYNDGGSRLCNATCDGEGGCNYAQSSLCEACNIEECDAECDENNRYIRDLNICRSACNPGTCVLDTTDTLPCEGNNCFISPGTENENGFSDSTCYFDVSCNADGSSFEEVDCNLGEIDRDGVSYCRYYSGQGNPCDLATQTCNAQEVILEEGFICDEIEGPIEAN